jgi:hypothetical protein
VEVVKKGEFDEITDLLWRAKDVAEKNPMAFVGLAVALVFLLLFLFGSASSSSDDQFS